MDLLWRDSAGTFLDGTENGATGSSVPFGVGTPWQDTPGGGGFAAGDPILWDDAAANPPIGDMYAIGIAATSAPGFAEWQPQLGGSSANSDLVWPGNTGHPWYMNNGRIGQAATPIGLGGTEWSLGAVNDFGGGLLWQPNGSPVQPPLFGASAIGGTQWTMADPLSSGILWSSGDPGGPPILGGAPQSTFMPAGSNPLPLLGDLLYAPNGNLLSGPQAMLGQSPQTPVNIVAGSSDPLVFGTGPIPPPGSGPVFGHS